LKKSFCESFVSGHDFSRAAKLFIYEHKSASQFAEKLFSDAFRAKNRLQVIESSLAEMIEITTLVPFQQTVQPTPQHWRKGVFQQPV